MSQVIYDNILASLYLTIWILTLIWYQKKSRILDAGSAIIATYIMYAVFSLFTLNDIMFSDFYKPLKVFPYIYLYVMLMIALSPIIYIHLKPAKKLENPHTRILSFISIMVFISSVLLIPEIITNFNTGIVKLFTDNEGGKDAYMERIEEASEAGSSISNIPAIIYHSFADIAIFLFYYHLTLGKTKKYILLMLAFTIFIGIVLPIMYGQRSGIVSAILTNIATYLLFRQYISRKINHFIQIAGLAGMIATAIPIAAITISRFSNLGGGIIGFVNWYVGQGSLYFNNFALDAGGTRNGDRTFNLAKRLIDPETPKNYVERRDKYHNLNIDDDIYSTFVGDFVIDFGPIVAVFIFIFFNALMIYVIRPRDGTLKLHQCLLLHFCICICMQGGMSLYSYADGGNLRIVTMLMLYGYLRYHEKLQESFPLARRV